MPKVACRICNNSFSVKPSHQKRGWGIYCSRACRDIGQRKGRYVSCHVCRKNVWRAPRHLALSKSGYFFCSKNCSITWKNKSVFIGQCHPLWNGGTATYRKRKIDSSKDQRCIRCGLSDFRVLVVHHVDHNRRNNELENLMWLCRNCHYLEHEGRTF